MLDRINPKKYEPIRPEGYKAPDGNALLAKLGDKSQPSPIESEGAEVNETPNSVDLSTPKVNKELPDLDAELNDILEGWFMKSKKQLKTRLQSLIDEARLESAGKLFAYQMLYGEIHDKHDEVDVNVALSAFNKTKKKRADFQDYVLELEARLKSKGE